MLHDGMLTDVEVLMGINGLWCATNHGRPFDYCFSDLEDAKAVAAAVYLLSERKHNEL